MAAKQPPISKTRVQRNRLIAATGSDTGMQNQPTQREIAAMAMSGLSGMGMKPATTNPRASDESWIRQEAAGLGLNPNTLTGDLTGKGLSDQAWITQQAVASGINPATLYSGAYRGSPTQAAVPTAPAATGYVAPQYTAAAVANPYLGYTQGLTALADQIGSNAGTEMSAIQDRYQSLRDQVMSQFGNTQNPELIAARDIALSELSRQAQDATRQVAANYQAAQGEQLKFAEQQRALGAELGAQNAGYANLAAGNIAAYADQAGVSDSAGMDVSRMLASRAPREQALASALGLSGGMFESAMGTSLGEQQMAIQGQIARDLAARGGQVSTSTAQQIAAAQMADREAQRQAYLNLALQESGALDQYRNQMSERDFALRQAMLQGGVEAGRFDVAQAQQSEENRMRQEESAYNRWLAEQELGLKKKTLALNEAELLAKAQGEKLRTYTLPREAKTLADWVRTTNPALGSADATNLETIAYTVGADGLTGLSSEQIGTLLGLWDAISPETKVSLQTQGMTSLQDYAEKYLKPTSSGSSPVRPTSTTTTRR